MALDLDSYREQAERFCEQIDREHYEHFAGHKQSFEIEAIYERHAELFARPAVERLRGLHADADGEPARRLRELLRFAFSGHLGQAVKAESAELAELQASLRVDVGEGEPLAYRGVTVALATEPDAQRRATIERARDGVLAERLTPLHLASLERVRALVRDLGWPSYQVACAELRGIDLAELGGQAKGFLDATDASYAALVDPELDRAGVPRLGELRRSDMPRFFRAVELDERFPADRLTASFAETTAGLGIDLGAQSNVHLDTEPRSTKSPRAFCAVPRVPDEIYLVIAPVGGRDDFAALFHEGGHTEHYASVDPALPFEHRHLGDNSVTESFAFLLEHLTEDPDWLATRLGVADPAPVVRHARAVKLVFLRRYAAKIAYELELHGEQPDLDRMPGRYRELLGGATRVAWPTASWLDDVDPEFYVACYLRAWALETAWRRSLRERFGERWFASPEAGEWLRSLWSQGQRLDGDELLADTLGEDLDLRVLADELVPHSRDAPAPDPG